MNCKSVQNHLSAYLDRELTGPEMLAIRAHLVDCDSCRQEEESLRALKRLLSATNVPEPSADLADRLCAAVLSNRRPEPSPRSSISLRHGVMTFVGVAAFSMAVTYSVRAYAHSATASSPSPAAVSAVDQDLDFDVQRDEVYATGLDATSGVPILEVPGDLGR